jgi:hypothetical protein
MLLRARNAVDEGASGKLRLMMNLTGGFRG